MPQNVLVCSWPTSVFFQVFLKKYKKNAIFAIWKKIFLVFSLTKTVISKSSLGVFANVSNLIEVKWISKIFFIFFRKWKCSFSFFFFFQVFIFLCKISNTGNVFFFHWKVKGIWKKSFLSNCENCLFFVLFQKNLKKNRSWSTTNQKILWEVLMSCEYLLQKFFFCRPSERYKKI